MTGSHTSRGSSNDVRVNVTGAYYERIKARGAKPTMLPAGVTGSTIAVPGDTCDTRIQLTPLECQ